MADAVFTMTQLATADRIYQRAVQTGGGGSKGYGTIPVTIDASVAGTVYARKRRVSDDAIIQAAWLVGTLGSTGSQSLDVTGVDAGTDSFYLDLSGDGSNWTSGTTAVFMGALFGIAGQSLTVRHLVRDSTDATTISGNGLTVNSAMRIFANAEGGPTGEPSSWVQSADASGFTGTGAVEFTNRMIAETGVAVGIVGKVQGNTTLANWQPGGGSYHDHLLNVLAAAGGRVEAMLLGIGHNDARFNLTAYGTMLGYLDTFWASIDTALGGSSAYQKVMFSIPNITNNAYNTDLASQTKVRGAFYDWAQANSATYLSYADLQLVSDGIHPSQVGAIRQARHIYRAMRGAAGLSGDDRGPLVTGVSRSGVDLTLPVDLQAGATTLVSQGSPATRIRVNRRGFSAALALDGSTPITVGTDDIILKLASDPGAVPLEIWPMGVHPVNDGSADMILDDHTDGDGITHGRALWENPYSVDLNVVGDLTVTSPTYSSTAFGGGLSAGYATAPFPVLPSVGNGVTIECFYKHLITSATHRIIFAQLDDFWLSVNNGNLVLTNTTITVGFTVGQTYHIALVCPPGGKNTFVYVDRVLVGTTTSNLSLASNTNPFTIRHWPTNSFPMGTGGEVAHVAVFKGARYLSDGSPPATEYDGTEENLLHLWKLQGDGADDAILSPPIAAAASSTFSPMIAAGAALLALAGIGSAAFSPMTGVSAAALALGGAGSSDFAPMTAAGVSTLALYGAGSTAFAPMTSSGAGQIIANGTGSGSVTFAAMTAAGVASLALAGDGSTSFAAMTGSGSAALGLTGGATATFAPMTSTGAGYLIAEGSGFGSVTFAPMTAAGVSSLALAGDGSTSFAAMTGAGVASLGLAGAGSASFAPLTSIASGEFAANGTGAGSVTFAPMIGAGASALALAGIGTATFAPMTAAAYVPPVPRSTVRPSRINMSGATRPANISRG
tara:strand:+ start:677 stop:3532 length:2856 start_codon:yes stop_codon:yes gene_type:complete